ncbi:MAG: hypothetical protein U0L79_07380 [Lachnospiraceae bacterium]|nr:hypothetical protein [Lachnospiraceae bacterium]
MQSRKFVNKLKSVVSIIVIMAMFILMGKNNVVYASSATVTISSATVTQGQEFKVNVDISADANIGAYNFYLEYDASVLQAVSGFEGGGGGRIQLMYEIPDTSSISKKLTKTITFKAIAPGSSAIKYVCISGDDGVIDYDTVDNMSVSPKNGSITVNAPVVASKNNNLSSMSIAAVREDGSSYDVTLSPAFSKDVTKYNISVEQGVTDLVVSAKTEDAKAKINVQWPNLDPGDNTTKVIVTAEDGSKKEYVIYTKVPVEETTPPMPEDPITTVIDGTEYYVGNINDSVALPEGFESFEYNYNGKTVVAGKGLVKDLIVMYLTSGTGEAGKLYIYDEATNSFYPMVNITMSQKLYTIVKAPEELVVPVGYNESVITIDGVEFTGWQISELEGIYLVYAMNWEGQAGLYYYDIAESQMMKYFDSSVEVGVELDDYNSLVSENESLKDDIAKLKETNVDGGKVLLYKYVIFIALFLVVILIGVIIVLVVKKNKDDADDEEERNDAIDSAFANIISKEEAEAAAQVEDDLEGNDEESAEETEVEETVEVSVLPEVLPEVSEEEIAEDIEQCEEATEDTEIEENMDEMADLEDVMDEIDDIIEEEFELREALKENSETVESEIETVREEIETIKEERETIDDISNTLANELKLAVDDIVAEEEAEITDDVESSEEVESVQETETFEEVEAVEAVEETEVSKKKVDKVVSKKKSTKKKDNKEKVAKILQDEHTSIKEDELDLVIDELFDDLFGE